MLLVLLGGLPGGILTAPGPAAAQETGTIEGQVVLGADSVPLDGAPVELHRIGRDTAGVVRRDTAGDQGRFTFRIPPADTGDLFLVTTRYDGVLYYGPPFHDLVAAPEPYLVVAHPSRSLPGESSLSLSRRHVVLTPSAQGVEVLDVAAAANDSSWTWTAPEGSEAVWNLAFPAAAMGVTVERGGVSPSEVTVRDGSARIHAAVPPGGQRIVMRYTLPPGGRVEMPIQRSVALLELLVQSPVRVADVVGLQDAGPVQFQGQEYRRYRARVLTPDATVRFTPLRSSGEDTGRLLPWLLVAGGVLLLAAGAWLHLRLRRRGTVV